MAIAKHPRPPYKTVFFLCCILLSLVFIQSLIADDVIDKPVCLTSVKDAILLAFKNNLAIQIQEKEVDATRAGIMQARSAILPQVDFQAAYTHNEKVPAQDIFFGYENNKMVGLSASQVIYDGGASIAAIKQAKLNLNIQVQTLTAQKLDVEFEAKRLYYGLLLAYETERITKELFGQAKAHYEDVKNKFEQGTSSKFDLLQSKIQVAKVVPELIKAKNAIDLIKAEFKKLLKIKMEDELKVTDQLAYLPVEINEPEFLRIAYLSQPQMNIRALGIDVNKWAIQVARASNRPQINASGNLAYNTNKLDKMFDASQRNWNAGISVSIPIFDGFSSKAKVDAAKSRYEESRLQKEDTGDQIAVDIRQGCLDLRQSQAIIDYTKDNIDEAKEALKISEVSYDIGEGTNLDVLDSQVSLSQVEENLASAVYDYLMADAFLNKTMGRLLEGDKK
ncbi:MAG: TolC family protein [Candidatus Omnitrophica bacterium]|nr:TolC family protein [Candidatus Omnitrophota bacterium]